MSVSLAGVCWGFVVALCVAKHCTVFRDKNAFRHSKQGDSPITGLDWWERNMRTIASDLCESTAKSTVQNAFFRGESWSGRCRTLAGAFPQPSGALLGGNEFSPAGGRSSWRFGQGRKVGPRSFRRWATVLNYSHAAKVRFQSAWHINLDFTWLAHLTALLLRTGSFPKVEICEDTPRPSKTKGERLEFRIA